MNDLRVATGLLVVLVVAWGASCGTASGGRALSLAGDTVGRALSSGGRTKKPGAWSLESARCGVFGDHRMACPQLRNCAALLGSSESGLTANVCVNDMGDLDPVKWCTYGEHWCRASELPACNTVESWPCDDFEIVVCEADDGRQRVMKTDVDSVSGRCGYRLMRHRSDGVPVDAGGIDDAGDAFDRDADAGVRPAT